jgi:hypothetical protein
LVTTYLAEDWLKARKQETDERLLVEAAQRDPRQFAELYARVCLGVAFSECSPGFYASRNAQCRL